MFLSSRLGIFLGLIVSASTGWGAATPAPAAAAEPERPADAFFAPITFTQPELSPDGTKICALMRFDHGHYALNLIDVATKQTRTLIKQPGWTVVNFWFKSNDLMLLLLESDLGVRQFQSLDLRIEKVKPIEGVERLSGLILLNALPDEPEEMLFAAWSQLGNRSGEAFRFNLRTGRIKIVEDDPGDVARWITNRKGEAIAATGVAGIKEPFFYWRTKKGEPWKRIVLSATMRSFGVAPDQRRLVVQDFEGTPTGRICYYDPGTGLKEEVAAARDVEATAYQFWGRNPELAALSYRTTERQVQFINEDARAADEWLAKALPDTERTYHSFSADHKLAILFAHNARNPGVFCLANLETRKLTVFGTSYPKINPTKTARARPFEFVSKDGHKLFGEVLLPTGVEKPPLIVLPGARLDGPTALGGFDFAGQFFASRGFAVARIDHRGTDGYGQTASIAGDFQIGTGMVQDIVEGMRVLSEKGWADPQRIGIVAEGWGGLIAFHLAAQLPKLRAFVNFSVPLRLEAYQSIAAFSTSGRGEEKLIAEIGGKKAARSYLDSIEPLSAAKKLMVPSLHYANEDYVKAAKELQTLLQGRGLDCEMGVDVLKPKKRGEWMQVSERYEAAATFFAQRL